MSTAPDNTGNPFAPPTAHVEDVAMAGAPELAGRGARLGAALIDTAIQLGIFYGLAFTLFTSLQPSLDGAESVSAFALQLVGGFVIFILLHGYLLATQGQTIGKKLVGLRIVRSNGERASPGRLIGLRYLLGWIIAVIPVVGMLYALVDCLMIFRESRKCLHDNIADTIVVKA
ncbi:MAG: RDD family protein [Rhizobiales bacterium]|nr:RDD family protein [Rhizobacter sp.]